MLAGLLFYPCIFLLTLTHSLELPICLQVYSTSVRIAWDVHKGINHTYLQLTVLTIDGANKVYRIITGIDMTDKGLTVHNLQPLTEYSVYGKCTNWEGESNTSDTLLFRTLSSEYQ